MTEPAGSTPDPGRTGCPLRDVNGDGVFDPSDQCPDVPQGAHPDTNRPGCPDPDSDGDGFYDSGDQCKDAPAGPHPDAERPGCPLADRDQDGIADAVDACPDKPGAPSAEPKKNGCPGLVELKNGKIVVLQQVFFVIDKDIILDENEVRSHRTSRRLLRAGARPPTYISGRGISTRTSPRGW